KQALLYPLILSCTAFIMCICLMLFIIPRFVILFQDQSLPFLTRFIFMISDVIHEYCFIALIPFFYFLFILLPLHANTPHRLAFKQTLLRIPFIMLLQKKLNIARFCNTLSFIY